jgi:hypothetical protein
VNKWRGKSPREPSRASELSQPVDDRLNASVIETDNPDVLQP